MLSNIGWPELIMVLLIVLVVFGAGRLPQIGEGVGKAIRNLKRGLKTDDDIEVSAKDARTDERGAQELPRGGARTRVSDEVADAEVVER